MSSHDFPVGSVVYFLHNKTERVLPAQIYEKIVRTSMDGEKSTYIVKVRSKPKPPSQDGFTLLEVDPSVVDIFQTSEEMKAFMVSRATVAVGSLVDAAVKASDVFGVQSIITQNDSISEVDEKQQGEDYESWHVPAADRPLKSLKKESPYAEVDLGDGRKARLKI